MRISFYGKLADAIGREIRRDDLGGRTVGELRMVLADAYPAAAADLLSHRVRVFVHDVVAGETHVIGSDDAIALLPPVSGG